jgi:hypothetical protein
MTDSIHIVEMDFRGVQHIPHFDLTQVPNTTAHDSVVVDIQAGALMGLMERYLDVLSACDPETIVATAQVPKAYVTMVDGVDSYAYTRGLAIEELMQDGPSD